jgi:hypothetical protein
MDAYDMLAVYRDAVECLEELGKAGKLPIARSVFWAELKAYTERTIALYNDGPALATIDKETGEYQVPIAPMLPALLTDIEGAAV